MTSSFWRYGECVRCDKYRHSGWFGSCGGCALLFGWFAPSLVVLTKAANVAKSG